MVPQRSCPGGSALRQGAGPDTLHLSPRGLWRRQPATFPAEPSVGLEEGTAAGVAINLPRFRRRVPYPPTLPSHRSQRSAAPCGGRGVLRLAGPPSISPALLRTPQHTWLIRENILSSNLNDFGIFRRAHVIFKLLPLGAALSSLGLLFPGEFAVSEML